MTPTAIIIEIIGSLITAATAIIAICISLVPIRMARAREEMKKKTLQQRNAHTRFQLDILRNEYIEIVQDLKTHLSKNPQRENKDYLWVKQLDILLSQLNDTRVQIANMFQIAKDVDIDIGAYAFMTYNLSVKYAGVPEPTDAIIKDLVEYNGEIDKENKKLEYFQNHRLSTEAK